MLLVLSCWRAPSHRLIADDGARQDVRREWREAGRCHGHFLGHRERTGEAVWWGDHVGEMICCGCEVALRVDAVFCREISIGEYGRRG